MKYIYKNKKTGRVVRTEKKLGDGWELVNVWKNGQMDNKNIIQKNVYNRKQNS